MQPTPRSLGRQVVEASESVPPLLEFVSFGCNRELLRASPLSQILSKGASIFASSDGSSSTYALSQPVDEIDVFISHNWVVGRWQKFFALAIEYNLPLAAAVSLSLQVLLVVLSAQKFLPTALHAWSDVPGGLACRALGGPVLLIVLLCGGEVRKCFRCAGPLVFLDKTCIHQVDEAIQKEGIRKLGAFLFHTRLLLVLYSENYLQRLWTIYEFACFMCLHPGEQIRLVPISWSRSVFAGLCGTCSVLMLDALLHFLFDGFQHTFAFACIVAGPALGYMCRLDAKERKSMRAQFADFTIDRCTCTCEEDRVLVYRNIAELSRAAKVAPTTATDEEALAVFNILVRAKLPQILETAMGRHGLRYWDYAILNTPIFGMLWLDALVGASHGLDLSGLCSLTLTMATFVLATLPLLFSALAKAMRSLMDLTGIWEWCYVIASGWLGAACAIVLRRVLLVTEYRNQGELNEVVLLNLCLVAANCYLTLWVYGVPSSSRRPCCRRALKVADEPV